MPRRWTASQMDRIMECIGSASLPQVHEDAPAAREGTAIHAALLRRGHCPDAIVEWVTDGDPTRWHQFEATYAWIPGEEHSTFVGCDLNRDYRKAGEGAVVGTADVVGWWYERGAGWHVRVGDLKTGHAQVRGGTLPPAGESWQLRTLAVLISRYLLDDSPRLHPPHGPIASCKVAHFKYIPGVRSIEIEEAPLAAEDLTRFADQIAARWRQHRDEPGQSFARGEHCRYCPSFDFCPAQQASIAALASGLPTQPPSPGEAWSDLRAAERIVERARASLLVSVQRAGGAVPSRPGYEITTTTRNTRRIDVEAAGSVLARRVDPRLRDACVRPTMTQASISEGLKALGLADFSVENIMTILTDAGAVETTESEPFLVERRARVKD